MVSFLLIMTKNQIEFHKLEESKRSNLANETEKHRSNVQQEKIGKANLLVRAYGDTIAGASKIIPSLL